MLLIGSRKRQPKVTCLRYVQLRAFHNVAVHGGFSRAAEALSLTQPAISDQVRKLEAEYDILLFERQRKKPNLTEFGGKLLNITRHMFELEQQAQDLLDESRALREATLRIIADSPHHLLHILAPFRKKYPGIFISLRAGNSDEVIDQLASYSADIGVLGEIPQNGLFDAVKLNSTPVIAFASINYPLGGKNQLSMHDLAELPLVVRERGSKTRKIIESMAQKEGVLLQATIEAEGREAVREIVAGGAGVGFVSDAEFGHDSRLIRLPIIASAEKMEEALVCLKERNKGKLINVFMTMASQL